VGVVVGGTPPPKLVDDNQERDMKRVGVMGLCLVAVACGVPIAATSASALEAPEMGHCVAKAKGQFTNYLCTKKASGTTVGKFEWEPGAVKTKFTGAGGVGTLETVHKVKVTCKTEASTGEFASPKTVGNILVTFRGCETSAFICSTAGAAEGEIVVNLLKGSLQWSNSLKTKVAIDLIPQTGEQFVEFTCGPVVAKVKGSVMTEIPTDVVKTQFELKFTAKAGKQKPEFYYTSTGEKVKDVLLSKLTTNGEFEQSGQTINNIQTDEEPLELNRLF
jgi:hypothetical protein